MRRCRWRRRGARAGGGEGVGRSSRARGAPAVVRGVVAGRHERLPPEGEPGRVHHDAVRRRRPGGVPLRRDGRARAARAPRRAVCEALARQMLHGAGPRAPPARREPRRARRAHAPRHGLRHRARPRGRPRRARVTAVPRRATRWRRCEHVGLHARARDDRRRHHLRRQRRRLALRPRLRRARRRRVRAQPPCRAMSRRAAR